MPTLETCLGLGCPYRPGRAQAHMGLGGFGPRLFENGRAWSAQTIFGLGLGGHGPKPISPWAPNNAQTISSGSLCAVSVDRFSTLGKKIK